MNAMPSVKALAQVFLTKPQGKADKPKVGFFFILKFSTFILVRVVYWERFLSGGIL